ncbi:MAG: ABC transporter ATP-binding protein [Candidatus Bruticola sp.]
MLELNNLSFTHKYARSSALHRISFTAEAGQMIALIGASSSGKSTLLQAIAGFIPYLVKGRLTGSIKLHGRNHTNLNLKERLKTVGYVSANPRSQLSGICSSVTEEAAWSLENLGLPPKEIAERTERTLREFSLLDLADRSPLSLSSGQQQRLILASILVLEPDILLLDEPSAFLDEQERLSLLNYVLNIASTANRIVIWSSSNIEEVCSFSRWLELDKGRLIYDGPPRQHFPSGSLSTPWTRIIRSLDLSYNPSKLPFTKDGAVNFLQKQAECTVSYSQQEANPIAPHDERSALSSFTIDLKDISFAYNSKEPVLNNINLTLETPDCTAIYGANGSGKTTLAKMLNGMLRPQRGSVSINGQDISSQPTWSLAAQVGFVFHNSREQIFTSSVWSETAFGPQNLGLTPTEINERCQEALELTKLTPWKDVHPYELSNSQLRLLSIAGVLAMRPQAVIMDEPNAALDEESWQILTQIFHYLRYTRPTLTLLITHNIDLISEQCQKIILLDKGRLQDFGKTEEVLRRHSNLPRPSVFQLGQALHLNPVPLKICQLKKLLPVCLELKRAAE